jgi:hypothetical protein
MVFHFRSGDGTEKIQENKRTIYAKLFSVHKPYMEPSHDSNGGAVHRIQRIQIIYGSNFVHKKIKNNIMEAHRGINPRLRRICSMNKSQSRFLLYGSI